MFLSLFYFTWSNGRKGKYLHEVLGDLRKAPAINLEESSNTNSKSFNEAENNVNVSFHRLYTKSTLTSSYFSISSKDGYKSYSSGMEGTFSSFVLLCLSKIFFIL